MSLHIKNSMLVALEDSGLPRFKSQLCCLISVWILVSYLISLYFISSSIKWGNKSTYLIELLQGLNELTYSKVLEEVNAPYTLDTNITHCMVRVFRHIIAGLSNLLFSPATLQKFFLRLNHTRGIIGSKVRAYYWNYTLSLLQRAGLCGQLSHRCGLGSGP